MRGCWDICSSAEGRGTPPTLLCYGFSLCAREAYRFERQAYSWGMVSNEQICSWAQVAKSTSRSSARAGNVVSLLNCSTTGCARAETAWW